MQATSSPAATTYLRALGCRNVAARRSTAPPDRRVSPSSPAKWRRNTPSRRTGVAVGIIAHQLERSSVTGTWLWWIRSACYCSTQCRRGRGNGGKRTEASVPGPPCTCRRSSAARGPRLPCCDSASSGALAATQLVFQQPRPVVVQPPTSPARTTSDPSRLGSRGAYTITSAPSDQPLECGEYRDISSSAPLGTVPLTADHLKVRAAALRIRAAQASPPVVPAPSSTCCQRHQREAGSPSGTRSTCVVQPFGRREQP